MIDTIVKTTSGTLKGYTEGVILKWFGVPFAQPPVDDLRFRRAQPLEPTTKSRLCMEPGHRPIQFSNQKQRSRLFEREDCLTLNIWRKRSDKVLPIIVYFYGGGFIEGEATNPQWDGTTFAHSDVLFISVNYRVGPLGFYDFSYLDPRFESNCAISDQIEALRWIHENASAFGGDPDNITIMGESAGAGCAELLLASPASRGLFNKVIAQSGVLDILHNPASNQEMMNYLLDQANINDVRELLTMDKKGLKAFANVANERVANALRGCWTPGPVMDDLIPETPVQAAQAGKTKDIAMLLGTDKNEGSIFMSLRRWFPSTWDQIKETCEVCGQPEAYEKLKSYYQHIGDEHAQLSEFLTDFAFRIPNLRLADAHEQNAPTFMYRFDYVPPLMNIAGWGAIHSVEMPCVFEWCTGRYKNMWRMAKAREKLTREMHTAWASFAKNGDPICNELDTYWEPYHVDSRKTYLFNAESTLATDPDGVALKAWEGIDLRR